MSIQALNWALSQTAGSPSAKAVLWSVANYANAEWCAHPSQALIAEESEQSTDSVQRRILDLVERGLLRRIPLKAAGYKTINCYILAPSPWFTVALSDLGPILPRGCVVDPKFVDHVHDSSLPQSAATQPQKQANVAATVRQHEPNEPLRGERERTREGQEPDTVTESPDAAEAAFNTLKSIWPLGALDDVAAARAAFDKVPADQWQTTINFVPQFLRLRKDAGRTKAVSLKTYLQSSPWSRPEAVAVAAALLPSVELKPFVRPLWAMLWMRALNGERVASALANLRLGARYHPNHVPSEEQEKRLRAVPVTDDAAGQWIDWCQKLGFTLPVPKSGILFLPQGPPNLAKLKYAWKGYNLLHETSITICSKAWWWRLYAKGAPIAEMVDKGRTSKGSVPVSMGPLPAASELAVMCEVSPNDEFFSVWATWFTHTHKADIRGWPESIWTPSPLPGGKGR